MPRRNYRSGYGSYYGGGGAEYVDPFAAAISGALDAYSEGQQRREEQADRRRQRERQDQLDRERQEDRAAAKADRESERMMQAADRRFRYAQEGFMERENPRTAEVPGLVPSFQIPGTSFQKVMPSVRERAADLETAIRQRHEADAARQQEARDRAALEAQADVLKRPDLKGLPLPQLKANIDALQQEEKTKREKDMVTFREQEQARFRPPKDPKDDTPTFLTPTAISKLAAQRTETAGIDYNTGLRLPGLSPNEASDAALRETENMRQAGFRAELANLTNALTKANQVYRDNPQQIERAYQEYQTALAALKRRYGQ